MTKIRVGYAAPLGTTRIGADIHFAVSVPPGKECELLLYHKGEKEPALSYIMTEEDAVGSVRSLLVSELDDTQYEYNYKIDGAVVLDPYVKEVNGRAEFGVKTAYEPHQIRGVICPEVYDWQGDKPLHIPHHDVIAYSLHVRGFTKHRTSRVRHKGTFAGMAEKIPYLLELGINQIQCMPIYEFEECQKHYTNYWGYGKGFYFAPKSSYAAGKSAINEWKDTIRKFHSAGIEVVLYFPFEPGIRGQMAEQILEYYVTEYHVDGFILNPLNAPMQSIAENPLLSRTKILKKEESFQNVMRRFLKGDEGMVYDVMWALRKNTKDSGAFNYITDHTGFTLQDLVSYDGKHNELNGEKNQDGPDYNYSWNCGAEGPSRRKSVIQLRKNQVRNAFFLLLAAQGMPCILAGDEFENTQKGNNNVYCQDNETAWLNWSKCKPETELLSYVKELITLRKAHPALHREKELLGLDQIACGIPDVSYHGENAWQVPSEVFSRQLGILYYGKDLKDNECFLAYNMHWLEHTFAIPTLPKGKKWYLVMKTQEGILKEPQLLKNQKKLELKDRTIAFLIGK